MKAIVYIRLKNEVLDPQGLAIENSLINLGHKNITNVRQGKLIEMDIDVLSEADAKKIIDNISKNLLANTVIEDFSIEIK
tara:strand:- start:5918 stop:6157 length:240 start_codon:yes stop_codon:yes gene_type:complete